ncbi:hypothetical protein K503DRAFT_771602 [Rhizopogon vinicolor AM-OR11-026]|uniref:Uncharacterized protein n=1 Tax=Rhizopogon vinicolor AM-OR11-026 TaxID=1314800 RepID=A0A1B7MXJ9_9AGAM|nr:hypothetical protein K503DRAFT_771602 [Rhizopogon vinicolor AM-OR11-026]
MKRRILNRRFLVWKHLCTLCQQLEGACFQFRNANSPLPLDLLKNLCALRWLKRTKPGGTTNEFSEYFHTVPISDQREKYKEEAKNLVSENSWNKSVNETQVY